MNIYKLAPSVLFVLLSTSCTTKKSLEKENLTHVSKALSKFSAHATVDLEMTSYKVPYIEGTNHVMFFGRLPKEDLNAARIFGANFIEDCVKSIQTGKHNSSSPKTTASTPPRNLDISSKNIVCQITYRDEDYKKPLPPYISEIEFTQNTFFYYQNDPNSKALKIILREPYEEAVAYRDSQKINQEPIQISDLKEQVAEVDTSQDEEQFKQWIEEYLAKCEKTSKLHTTAKDWFIFCRKLSLEIHDIKKSSKKTISTANLCIYENAIKAKDLLAALSSKIESFSQKYSEYLSIMKEQIKEEYLKNEQQKKDFLEALTAFIDISNEFTNESLCITRMMIHKEIDIINFLSEKSGTFSVYNGGFLFANSKDIEMFHRLFKAYREVEQQGILNHAREAGFLKSLYGKDANPTMGSVAHEVV